MDLRRCTEFDAADAVAEYVPRYGDKKSRELPHGVIGRRKSAELLEVEQEEVALSWCTANGVPVKTEWRVVMKELQRAWKERRQRDPAYVPPGCKIVEAEEKWQER